MLKSVIRSFCLLALTVSGVVPVPAGLASGLDEPPASGLDETPASGTSLAERMSVTEALAMALDDRKPHEERALPWESLFSKLTNLPKSMKTKIAARYASLVKSSTVKHKASKRVAVADGRKQQDSVKRSVGDHQIVTPGAHENEVIEKLLVALHQDSDFALMLTFLQGSLVLDKYATRFHKFMRLMANEGLAAQKIYRTVRSNAGERDLFIKYEELEHIKWLVESRKPTDVASMVQEGGGKMQKKLRIRTRHFF